MNQEIIDSLDLYIRDNIVKLNKLGMRTLWCCSGLEEDHKRIIKEPFRQAYLCVSLDSISKKTLRKLALSDIPNQRPTNRGYEAPTWIVEVRGLLGNINDDAMSIPCLTFRINYSSEDRFGHEETQASLRRRWDQLFEVLLEILNV
jgi:hypothetical protein